MARISERVAAIAESATLAVDAKAKALKAAGEPVIGSASISESGPIAFAMGTAPVSPLKSIERPPKGAVKGPSAGSLPFRFSSFKRATLAFWILPRGISETAQRLRS